ncbi:MAG: hypothetical protein GWP05_03320 [Anaerolineaceae bacterium]|nr:hypothetical protein [Anaerolineaceae bacterium]
MSRESQITRGEVTARSGNKLRYEFRVDGRRYTYANDFDPRSPWCRLPRKVSGNNELDIRYVPESPDINRPAVVGTDYLALARDFIVPCVIFLWPLAAAMVMRKPGAGQLVVGWTVLILVIFVLKTLVILIAWAFTAL